MIDESCLTALDKGEKTAVNALSQLAFHRKKSRNLVMAKKKVLEHLMHVASFQKQQELYIKHYFIGLLKTEFTWMQ